MTTPHAPMAPTSPPAPPDARDPRRSMRWAAIIAAVWALLLAGFWWWGIRTATPTAREQTTVAQARPYVDEAAARVAVAAGSRPDTVVAIGPFESYGECDVSVFRSGERYRRSVVAVVPPGAEASLMSQVAAELPASYAATASGGDNPRLYADAGLFVRLTGAVTAPGEVTFLADTGDCRDGGGVSAIDPSAEAFSTSTPSSVASAVAGALELAGGPPTSAAVSCVDGGFASTVAVRAPAYAGDVSVALADRENVVVATERLFAFRGDAGDVAVRARADATLITVTTLCP